MAPMGFEGPKSTGEGSQYKVGDSGEAAPVTPEEALEWRDDEVQRFKAIKEFGHIAVTRTLQQLASNREQGGYGPQAWY